MSFSKNNAILETFLVPVYISPLKSVYGPVCYVQRFVIYIKLAWKHQRPRLWRRRQVRI